MPRLASRSLPRAARLGAAVATVALALTSATETGVARTDTGDTAVPSAPSARSADSLAKARALELDIRQAAPPAGYTTFVNSGSAALDISVISDDGGTLVDARPRIDPGGDRAVRYPRYNGSPDAPHAVIQILDRRGTDDLDPGTQPFRFGADFTLDKMSEDPEPGGRDNGDNLLQRGLFEQRAQYKIQLDHRIPTCRVKGTLGAVEVSSSVRPVAGSWYRVRCLRLGNQLTIVVTQWNAGMATSLRQSASGPIGDVSPPRRTVPVSIGGKLARRGVVNEASDQFNGRIDNVIIRIG